MSGPSWSMPSNEAHLWCVRAGEDGDGSAPLDGCERLATEAELERARRYVFERDRRAQIVTRALVRTLLSRYAAVDPKAWRFEPNRWGRPRIVSPAGTGLDFNVSHTRGLVVCLVAADGRDPGVDVENVARRRAPLDVAERFFAPAEVRALRSLPAAERPSRFFAYWTLKESYIKARGMGLALPLDGFAFDVEREPIAVALEGRMQDDAVRWSFSLHRPTDEHLVACAVLRPAAGRGSILVRHTTARTLGETV